MQKLLALYKQAIATEIPPYDPMQAAFPFMLEQVKLAHTGRGQVKAKQTHQEQTDAYEARLTKLKAEKQQLKDETRALRGEISSLKARGNSRGKRSWWKSLIGKKAL